MDETTGLSVHDDRGAHDGASKSKREQLMAQAHAEERHARVERREETLARANVADSVGSPGSRTEHDGVVRAEPSGRDIQLVVDHDIYGGAGGAHGLGQVEGEGVVIVDEEDLHEFPEWGWAC